jgi:hypothetical protein
MEVQHTNPRKCHTLKIKYNLLYIRNQSYRAVNTLHHGYKNQ